MHKYVAFDTEATGVDFSSSQLIQCGAIFLDDHMQPISRHSWNVNYIPEKFSWDEEAAAVHGISREKSYTHGVSPETFLREFEAEVVKHGGLGMPEMHIIAANAYFDYLMFEALWETYRPGEVCPISRRVVDLTGISLTVLGDAGMTTMLEKLAIPYDDSKQHDATYDAELHLKIFLALITVAKREGIPIP